MANEYCTPQDISKWMVLKKDPWRDTSANADAVQANIDMGNLIIHYDAGDIIRITDDDTPIGEYLTILSLAGTVVTCTTNLVNSYTTAKHSKIQNQSHFTPESEPNKADMVNMINMNQDIIDRDLHTTYLQDGRLITEELTHILRAGRDFPYYSMPMRYGFNKEDALVMKKCPIMPVDRSKGDQLWLQWGEDWKDALDPVNDRLIWDGEIETIVDDEVLSAALPITSTLAQNLRISGFLHWKFNTHAQITAYTLEIIGVKMDGTSDTETFSEGDDWEGWTTNAYQSITSVKLTARTGTGVGDTFKCDTQPEKSRLGNDYDLWIVYRLGHIYHKGDTIDPGFWTTKVVYRYGWYHQEGDQILGDLKKICILRCAMDILGNERYAMNLVSAGDLTNEKVSSQLSRWEAEYEKTIAKRRQSPIYRRYE